MRTFLCGHSFSFLLLIYLGVELLSHGIFKLFLKLWLKKHKMYRLNYFKVYGLAVLSMFTLLETFPEFSVL